MRPLLYIAIIVSLTIPVASVSANGRDSDGSRLQARPFKVGSAATDRLSPPGDAVDWRYFKLKEAQTLKFSVNSDQPVSVSVSGATGKSVASTRSKNGKATMERRFEAGLYYFSVTSNKSTAYSIRID